MLCLNAGGVPVFASEDTNGTGISHRACIIRIVRPAVFFRRELPLIVMSPDRIGMQGERNADIRSTMRLKRAINKLRCPEETSILYIIEVEVCLAIELIPVISGIMNAVNRHFLSIAVGASILALALPVSFLWVKPFIPFLLGIIMFGMGTTIQLHDFRDVWEKRHVVFLAALLQFTLMPGLGVIISLLLSLPEEVMIGMVLVGSCPGGTASNVIVYLARGNVALSVTMTMFSTVLAPLLTPGIIFLLLSRSVDLSFASLFLSVFQVVAVPLAAGVLVRYFFGNPVVRYSDFLPGVSVLSITLIIACVMALNADKVMALPLAVAGAVVMHNLLGLLAGYGMARLLSCRRVDCRTVAIEIGMQNSGLGVALANQFFQPLSALPGALFSLWHNLSGIVLAKYWEKRKSPE